MIEVYPQINDRPQIPWQSVCIYINEDSIEYIASQLDRLEQFLREYGAHALFGGIIS